MAAPLDGIVLLTGASSGIGMAMARQLAGRSQVLVLVARRVERLEALAAELRAAHPKTTVDVRPADLGDTEAARTLAAAVEADHGRIDALINNAGLGQIGFFEQTDPRQLELMLKVNVIGLSALTRAVLPGMLQRRHGGILNVSSGFGLTWLPMFSAYVGTKHYVTAFTECLRAELRGTGVSACQLCPGPVATEFEEVADNKTGQKTPTWAEISAEKCAAVGLRGFDGNRALTIPGLVAWLAITAGRLTPRPLARFIFSLAARNMRNKLSAPAS
ncbi:MAG: SDR family NAD(P)-dependent oxidoreductase [Myxococcales bacterium]|nr:SDR family NAD(P)-dependent oxidoreductase [Myxococcales bacterium]